ncbi:hypothetical protein ACFLSJ_08745 [Verrucomicrobiota bacterium]
MKDSLHRQVSDRVLRTALLIATAGSPLSLARETEQSLQDLSFKATHNSYDDKPHTITEQIDDYNVWCIELDLCGFVHDDNTQPISIRHGGGGEFRGTFREFLGHVTASSRWRSRVIFIWMDIKNDDGCNWGAHGEDSYGNVVIIEDRLKEVLGEPGIYTQSDWMNDGMTWPSVEELIQRGKHFVCIYDENSYDDLFPALFVTSHKESETRPWTGFLNTKDNGNGDFPVGDRPGAGNRFMWRSYDLNSSNEFSVGAATGRHPRAGPTAGPSAPTCRPSPTSTTAEGDRCGRRSPTSYPSTVTSSSTTLSTAARSN